MATQAKAKAAAAATASNTSVEDISVVPNESGDRASGEAPLRRSQRVRVAAAVVGDAHVGRVVGDVVSGCC